MEKWKNVKGYEDLYQISSHGRLKSFHKNRKGQIMSIKNSKGWYLSARLSKDSTQKTHRIHRLVAEHFLINTQNKKEVNHKDGNKQNNNVNNLEWVTPRENIIHAVAMNPNMTAPMIKQNRFERPKRVMQYDMDGNFIAEYANATIASIYTGVCGRNILQVANKEHYKPGRIRKQAGGYKWKINNEEKVI